MAFFRKIRVVSNSFNVIHLKCNGLVHLDIIDQLKGKLYKYLKSLGVIQKIGN